MTGCSKSFLVLLLWLFATHASSVLVPTVNLTELTEKADLIVVGAVTSVRDKGHTTIQVEGQELSGSLMNAELRVDQIIKGSLDSASIAFEFFITDAPIGLDGLRPSDYRLFFFKKTPEAHAFVSPYLSSVPAIPGRTAQGVDASDRVVQQLAAVLEAPSTPGPQKLEAIYALRSMMIPAATLALRSNLQRDPTIRFSAVAALLARNDVFALNIAQDTLLTSSRDVAPYVLQNIRNAIAEGVKNEQAVPPLTQLLRSSNVETRRAAALALRHVGSPLVIAPLISAMEDLDFDVRYYAIVGLADITGQGDWRPSTKELKNNEQYYRAYWREWAKRERQ